MSELLFLAAILGIGFAVLYLAERAQRRAAPSSPEEAGRNRRIEGVAFLAAVMGLLAVWYFGVYDTATGRCNRGDLGACIVAAEQQSSR